MSGMIEERLVRVERFEELRAGSYLVYRDCSWCHAEHRFMCLSDGVRTGEDAQGRIETTRGWTVVPSPRHCEQWRRFRIVDAAVNRGAVYRIATDEPKAQETKRTRVKERAR